MDKHIMSISRRKVSDFIRLENGTVGNRSAFTTAALVAASSFAALLLTATTASAGCWDACDKCGGYCCEMVDPGCGGFRYVCSDDYIPGETCWWVGQ